MTTSPSPTVGYLYTPYPGSMTTPPEHAYLCVGCARTHLTPQGMVDDLWQADSLTIDDIDDDTPCDTCQRVLGSEEVQS